MNNYGVVLSGIFGCDSCIFGCDSCILLALIAYILFIHNYSISSTVMVFNIIHLYSLLFYPSLYWCHLVGSSPSPFSSFRSGIQRFLWWVVSPLCETFYFAIIWRNGTIPRFSPLLYCTYSSPVTSSSSSTLCFYTYIPPFCINYSYPIFC